MFIRLLMIINKYIFILKLIYFTILDIHNTKIRFKKKLLSIDFIKIFNKLVFNIKYILYAYRDRYYSLYQVHSL